MGITYAGGDRYDKWPIPSDAMTPVYGHGAEVWFERVGPREVGRGDVVLATPPASWQGEGDLLKRVVALGGDHIRWAKGDAA
ncbi:S24/S26 family peptidase [Streptomyces sp. 5.8]|uniref:S24/S26 family peptidase n=1 Tax=Streptomyces sp. 5.8 TaxID=3406571 RepID=UPI003BB523BE